ncbi:Hypothetical protein FSTVST1_391 [Faustovirus ST1]|nr:Hypothetical protein FSTVST1_391 [Faustovirus ST1]
MNVDDLEAIPVFPNEILLEIAFAAPGGYTALYHVCKSLHAELSANKQRARDLFMIEMTPDRVKFHEERLDVKFTTPCDELHTGELCGIAVVEKHSTMWSLKYNIPFTTNIVNGDVKVYKRCNVVLPSDEYRLRGVISVVYGKITLLNRLNILNNTWEEKQYDDYPATVREIITSDRFYI